MPASETLRAARECMQAQGADGPLLDRMLLLAEAIEVELAMGDAPKKRFPTTCLKPDALDSACPCCQRWFYAAYGQYEPPEVQSEVARP